MYTEKKNSIFHPIIVYIFTLTIFLAPLLSEIKETPFQSTLHKDVTYRQRHVEESWIHLLKCGDIIKLKSLCMCNYDFLLAAVSKLLYKHCLFSENIYNYDYYDGKLQI